jgi:segregation and condensation protein A
MFETEIHVKIDSYDGPLSLLLLLIQKEDMDIKNLNLPLITEQYLEYLAQLQEINFDEAGEYLFLASSLLFLKSESCVGRENEKIVESEGSLLFDIMSKSELIRRLEELKKFQQLGQALWVMPKKGVDEFTRPKIVKKNLMSSLTLPMELNSLVLSMADILKREKRKISVVNREKVSIRDKVLFLKSFFEKGLKTEFSMILKGDEKNLRNFLENKVASFMAILELVRLNKITVFQNEAYSEIYIEVIESLKDLDVNLVENFETQAEKEKEKEEYEVDKLLPKNDLEAVVQVEN